MKKQVHLKKTEQVKVSGRRWSSKRIWLRRKCPFWDLGPYQLPQHGYKFYNLWTNGMINTYCKGKALFQKLWTLKTARYYHIRPNSRKNVSIKKGLIQEQVYKKYFNPEFIQFPDLIIQNQQDFANASSSVLILHFPLIQWLSWSLLETL